MNCVIVFDFIKKLLYKSYVSLLFRAHIKMAYEEWDRDTRAALPYDGERSQETRGAGDVRIDSLHRTWEATTWLCSEYILFPKGIRNALVRGNLYFLAQCLVVGDAAMVLESPWEGIVLGPPPSLFSPKPNYSHSKLHLPVHGPQPAMTTPAVSAPDCPPPTHTHTLRMPPLSGGRVLLGGVSPRGGLFKSP